MISPFSSSCLPPADKVFADVGVRPRTDDQIREFIAEKIARFRFRSGFLSQKRSTGSLLQAEYNTPSSTGDELPQTSKPFKDQQRLNPAAVGLFNPKAKRPLEESGSRVSRTKSMLNTSSKRKVYPQVLSEVAATSKNQEESTSNSVKTVDKLTENRQSSANGRKDLLLKHSKRAAREEERVPLTSKQSNSLGLAPINQTEQVCNEVEPNNVAEMLRSPTLKQPQYDDISDEDTSQQYNQGIQSIKNSVVKMSSEPSTRNTAFELARVETQINSKLGQELVSPETESCCTCYVETGDDRLCAKCDREFRGQMNSCVDLEDELESQHDDDDDGDWEVVPLSIFSLIFEQAGNQLYPENFSQDCDSGEELSPRLFEPAPKPVPASAFLKLKVFDTPGEQKQAGKFGRLSFVEPSSSSSHEREPQTLKRRRDSCSEHEDSCETDYSSDYSSGPESNYMTASKQLLSAPVKTKTDELEIKNVAKARNLKKGQENGVNQSIIIHDSDSESDDDCVETESEKTFTSSEKMTYSPETKASVDTQRSTSSTPTDKHVQNESTKKISKEKDIIILSDSDDDCRDMSIRAKEVSQLGDSGKTAMVKNVLQDLKPSADVPKPKPDESDQKTSRPGNKDVKKDNTAKKLETEVSRDNLNDSGSGLYAKRKKGNESTVHSPRSDQKSERFSEGAASTSSRPENVQASAPFVDEVPDESMSTLNPSSKKSSFKLKHSGRDEPASNSDPRDGVHNATLVTPNQNSLKRIGSSKRHRSHSYESSTSYPSFPLRKSLSLTTPQSVQGLSHARTKVYSDWQQKHVPRRRERRVPSRYK